MHNDLKFTEVKEESSQISLLSKLENKNDKKYSIDLIDFFLFPLGVFKNSSTSTLFFIVALNIQEILYHYMKSN